MRKFILAIIAIASCLVSCHKPSGPSDYIPVPDSPIYRPVVAPTAVFIGDSIFDNWDDEASGHPNFFSKNNYLNYGKSGQTSNQIAARFSSDALSQKPQCVVIIAGTNDISNNGGKYTNEFIMENLVKMGNLAQDAKVKVAMCSLLPTDHYWWNEEMPAAEITKRVAQINLLIQNQCKASGWTYVDFFTPMADTVTSGIMDKYSDDRIHPNKDGYLVMEGIIKPIIDQLIK